MPATQGDHVRSTVEKCSSCNGSGKDAKGRDCADCAGTGTATDWR